MLTSILIICFITSAAASVAIVFIFDMEDFFKSFISFSVDTSSFSISSLNFCFLFSISLSSFFLLSSIIFCASFFEFSIISLYSLSFFSAFSLSFSASSRSLTILDFLFSILYVIFGKKIFQINKYKMEKKVEASENLAKSKTDIGWGHQIRSYVLQPYQLVKDLRNNLENTDPDRVLDGDIDGFLEAALYQTKDKR